MKEACMLQEVFFFMSSNVKSQPLITAPQLQAQCEEWGVVFCPLLAYIIFFFFHSKGFDSGLIFLQYQSLTFFDLSREAVRTAPFLWCERLSCPARQGHMCSSCTVVHLAVWLACGLAEWRASRSRNKEEAAAAERAEQWSEEASRHNSTQQHTAQSPGGAHSGRICCPAGCLIDSPAAIRTDATRAVTLQIPGRTRAEQGGKYKNSTIFFLILFYFYLLVSLPLLFFILNNNPIKSIAPFKQRTNMKVKVVCFSFRALSPIAWIEM